MKEKKVDYVTGEKIRTYNRNKFRHPEFKLH